MSLYEEFTFVHFGREITTKEVEAKMEKKDLRPATYEQLLMFSRKYCEFERRFMIVALGSPMVVNGNVRVSCLLENGTVPILYDTWPTRKWRDSCRFLAVL